MLPCMPTQSTSTDCRFRPPNLAIFTDYCLILIPRALFFWFWQAVELLQRHDVEQRILSDANEFYIETILEAKGLGGGVFSRVVSVTHRT